MSAAVPKWRAYGFEVTPVVGFPNHIRMCVPEDAEKWGVYWRPRGGLARHIVDCDTEAEALAIVEGFADDLTAHCRVCGLCEDLFCLLHDEHWSECPCPGSAEVLGDDEEE